MNNIIKYEEMENINNISYSSLNNWIKEEYTTNIINNCDKIICELFINDELKKTLEIELEIWHNLIKRLFKIIKQRNYFWNKQYFVKGDENVLDVYPWKIEIKNKKGECIEIKCKGKNPEIFTDFLTIIYDIERK